MNQFRRFHLYVSMVVTIAGIYTTFHPQWLNHFSAFMTVYLVGGCFVDEGSMLIHHILCIFMFAFRFIYDRDYEPFHATMLIMINCEYSSFFYNGWPILNDLIERYRPDMANTALTKYGKIAFKIGFFVTFVKFRIWDIGAKIVLNPASYSWQPSIFGDNWIPYVYYNVNVFAFYLLNLYWVLLIIKKTVGSIVANFNTHLWCEYFTQYSCSLSFIFAFIVYYWSGLFDIPAVIHCHGLLFLMVGSYLYHRSLYLKIKQDGESIDCLECGEKLKADVFGVNIHLFSTIVARSWHYCESTVIVFLHIIFIGGCCLSSCYFTPRYIDKMKSDGIKLICDKEIINRYYLHALINFPCFLGSIAVVSMTAIITQSYSDSVTNLFLYLCIYFTKIMIIKMEPFYKLSHVAVHFVLACHHAIMASQIIRMRSQLSE